MTCGTDVPRSPRVCPRAIMDVLGHAEIGVTMNTYANPRELHQTGALALVAWWAGFRNGCGRLVPGTA